MNGIERLSAAPSPDPHVALRKLAVEMEGVFYKQLFDAMRKGVPSGGPTASSFAQGVFTSMLDEKVAAVAAEKASRGLSEALYRQLSRRLDGDEASALAANDGRKAAADAAKAVDEALRPPVGLASPVTDMLREKPGAGRR